MNDPSNKEIIGKLVNVIEEELVVKNVPLNEQGVQILLNEYNQCNERIESFLNRQDAILQISMAIIGGTIAFTLLNPIPEELYMAIPIIPIMLFIHISYHYTRVIANQGYREYLQQKLNKNLPQDSFVKYTTVGKEFLLNNNPIARINSVVFPSLILGSILFSIIMSNFNLLVIVGNILILILVAIATRKLFNFTINLNEEVKEFCEKN